MSAREVYEKATNDFIIAYNQHAQQALQLEKTNNSFAADKHVALSSLVAKYLSTYEKFIDPGDRLFLRNEIVARCMQALVLRSMQLSGFADLALSLSSTRNIQADIERARRRLEDARDDTEDDTNDLEDPRVHTKGLYEYIPHEEIDVSIDDLPGYENQHRQIFNAYFVINGSIEQTRRIDETIERKPKTRAGANVILYGPPGTGKTAAARAVARSLGLNLAFVNAENLLSAYRSETEKNLRALYDKMRAIVRISGRNIVLLLDEVDGLVKNRSNGARVTSGEYSLLTRFLTILEPNDGKDNYGIFSIFTTNRLSNLDDAFRRRCSAVFMGYVESSASLVRLFDAFLDNVIDYSTRNKDVERSIHKLCRYWVPGDFARAKRSIVDPYQLEKYLRRTNTSYSDFIASRLDDTVVGGGSENRPPRAINIDSATMRSLKQATPRQQYGSREIVIDLPLLSYEELMSVLKGYIPITPSSKYAEYLATADAEGREKERER